MLHGTVFFLTFPSDLKENSVAKHIYFICLPQHSYSDSITFHQISAAQIYSRFSVTHSGTEV
ncbi:hypothetical protein RchiOBHm_Chr4g0418461 [Rosa chinensis]|uniref:Uncharacterized protein n=1 Tax=Rosa chinensis TaxID=74649 RepID=A0A2P6QXC0_ROSCH|nr:hypothetical protein RchiOBHm_Chr4g0418461 [Rosa chinensis]